MRYKHQSFNCIKTVRHTTNCTGHGAFYVQYLFEALQAPVQVGNLHSTHAEKHKYVQVNCSPLLTDLNKILVNLFNIKFHENPLLRSIVVTCKHTHKHGEAKRHVTAPKTAGMKSVHLNET